MNVASVVSKITRRQRHTILHTRCAFYTDWAENSKERHLNFYWDENQITEKGKRSKEASYSWDLETMTSLISECYSNIWADVRAT